MIGLFSSNQIQKQKSRISCFTYFRYYTQVLSDVNEHAVAKVRNYTQMLLPFSKGLNLL